MESEQNWYEYEIGTTVGRRGPAGGRVQHDEEFGDPEETEDADARVTLESMPDDSFAVTVNLYGGWLQETATFASLEMAKGAFEKAKADLARLAESIPDEEERDLATQIERLNREVAVFVVGFGGRATL